jgi:hypothetical protein
MNPKDLVRLRHMYDATCEALSFASGRAHFSQQIRHKPLCLDERHLWLARSPGRIIDLIDGQICSDRCRT